MYKCLFCGLVNSSETAKLCSECGPNGPANDWTPEEIDQEAKVTQYASMLGEFYFEAENHLEVDKHSLKMRERLRISHEAHSVILSKLEVQKKAIEHLTNFRLEFNENVMDAFAGHDTFLDFRFTNLSEDDAFKVSLVWDDPETTDRVDFRAETKTFVMPHAFVTIGSKAIFDRIGIKEISDLQLTISDRFGESARFRAESFRFKVGNHDQKISNNITTTQNISIEGRGVVDASGVGADNSNQSLLKSNIPIWKELKFFYLSQSHEKIAISIPTTTPPLKEDFNNLVTDDFSSLSVNTVTPVADIDSLLTIEFDEDDVDAISWAAEQGSVKAQELLGDHYYRKTFFSEPEIEKNMLSTSLGCYMKVLELYQLNGDKKYESGNVQGKIAGLYYRPENHVQKNYWIEKQLESYLEIAEQGNVNAQTAIGAIFSDASLSVHDDAKAAYWYLKAAENGFIDAQQVLGRAYEEGTIGLQKDYPKAANWYLKAAQQGDPYSSLQLGYLNLKGLGVEQDFVKAEYWFELLYRNTPEPYSRGRIAFKIAKEYENLPDRNNEKIIFWLKEAEENLKKDLKKSFEEFYDFEKYGESCSALLLARSQSRLSIAFELLKDKTSKSFWEKKAFKHWLVLAENGLAEAQLELGWFYLNGWGGVEQDWKISSMWLEKAAHQGNPKAQIDLGMSYEYGRGVPKNLNLALLWYRKGYEGGYDSGGNFVEELEKKLKKGILRKLFT